MKKILLFIVLLFSLFFLNPTETFAYTYVPEDIKITFWNSQNQTDTCEGLKQCYNFLPDKIASRIQVQSQKVSFTEGKQYKMYISLKLSVPNDYTIYDYYLSDYLVRNYAINVNKSDFKFLYWDDFGWFNVYQWDLEITVNPTFQGSGVSFDFYKSQDTNQQIWILDVLDFHSELLSDSADTNSIIDNDNRNTQDIINNQNQNNEELKDTIKDQFEKCEQGQNILNNTGSTITSNGITYIVNEDGSITLNGTSTNTSSFVIQRNLNLEKGTYYIIPTNSNSISFIGYDGNTWPVSLNSVYNTFTLNEDKTFIQFYYQIPSGYTFNNFILYPMISKTPITSYQKYGEEVCSNRIDETNDQLGNINDALTDDSSPDLSSLENSAGWLPPGPVDSILNLPLSLFQNLTDNLSKSCQPLTLTLPYVNRNIVLPCISSLYDKIGIQSFLNWVGVVCCCFILYNYFLNLYKWVDDTLTFRENNWQDWGGV